MCSAMGWNYACQKALHLRLIATVRRPIHISPHMGKLSSQVKSNKAAATPRTFLGTSHVEAWEPRR
jgi:hypothetical protein